MPTVRALQEEHVAVLPDMVAKRRAEANANQYDDDDDDDEEDDDDDDDDDDGVLHDP